MSPCDAHLARADGPPGEDFPPGCCKFRWWKPQSRVYATDRVWTYATWTPPDAFAGRCIGAVSSPPLFCTPTCMSRRESIHLCWTGKSLLLLDCGWAERASPGARRWMVAPPVIGRFGPDLENPGVRGKPLARWPCRREEEYKLRRGPVRRLTRSGRPAYIVGCFPTWKAFPISLPV